MATPRSGSTGTVETKGDIVGFDGSDLVRVPVGTDGKFLQALSTEASGLGWGDVGLAAVNGLRLTGVSATPIMTADSTALATIYLTPYKHNAIALYNGSYWKLYFVTGGGGDPSLAVTGRTTDLPFDIFAYASGVAITLEFLNWTNATTRATALARQDGVFVKSGDATRRYLGTCRPRSATTFHWVLLGAGAPAKFDLWNVDNRVIFAFSVVTPTNTWNYTTNAWRQAQGSANYQVDVVAGELGSVLLASLFIASSNSTLLTTERAVAIGFDSTTVATGIYSQVDSGNNVRSAHAAAYAAIVPIGRHFSAWLERSEAASTTTWYGDDGGTGRVQTGMGGTYDA
jgi:hypothetical protein